MLQPTLLMSPASEIRKVMHLGADFACGPKLAVHQRYWIIFGALKSLGFKQLGNE